jgi:hypothetical protein
MNSEPKNDLSLYEVVTMVTVFLFLLFIFIKFMYY